MENSGKEMSHYLRDDIIMLFCQENSGSVFDLLTFFLLQILCFVGFFPVR